MPLCIACADDALFPSVKGMEDALIARNKRGGNIYKAIYPSRSFGDSDFKTRTKPIPALIATPTGRGVRLVAVPSSINFVLLSLN